MRRGLGAFATTEQRSTFGGKSCSRALGQRMSAYFKTFMGAFDFGCRSECRACGDLVGGYWPEKEHLNEVCLVHGWQQRVHAPGIP
jgi:hypothetical protein